MAALKDSASGVILSRNHPSDILQPSSAELQLTRRVKDRGSLLDIAVLAHVILAGEGYQGRRRATRALRLPVKRLCLSFDNLDSLWTTTI